MTESPISKSFPLTINTQEHGTTNDQFLDLYIELQPLQHLTEINDWHNHQTVFDHTQLVVSAAINILSTLSPELRSLLKEEIDTKSKEELIIVATLFHDIGKINTFRQDNGKTTTIGHETEGAKMIGPILMKYNFSPDQIAYVTWLIEEHGNFSNFLIQDENQFLQTCQILKNEGDLLGITILGKADLEGSDYFESNPDDYNFRHKRCSDVLNKAQTFYE
jgi:putative nucleotidyltransferase with HDIG domain